MPLNAIGIEEIKKPEGNLGFLIGLLQRAVLPGFVRHPRVRRAWTRLYSDGKARLEQLSKPARESFLNETDFLDAWVQARLEKARRALDSLDLVRQRRVYVAVPVRVNDAETGEMIDQPSIETLRCFFARPRAIVSIVGEGGSGESTLACALARWAMASQAEECLGSHRMLAVVVVEDTTNLLESIVQNLRRMLGEEELPDDLLRGLLAEQRLLVIVDALSERELPTQRHIETLYDQGWPINALIITSRRDPDLKAVDRRFVRSQLYRSAASGSRERPLRCAVLSRCARIDGAVGLKVLRWAIPGAACCRLTELATYKVGPFYIVSRLT